MISKFNLEIQKNGLGGHFICFKCAKQSVTIKKATMKEIIANFTYFHEVTIAENKCPRCRSFYEMNELRSLYL